jgi:hypothetical protein
MMDLVEEGGRYRRLDRRKSLPGRHPHRPHGKLALDPRAFDREGASIRTVAGWTAGRMADPGDRALQLLDRIDYHSIISRSPDSSRTDERFHATPSRQHEYHAARRTRLQYTGAASGGAFSG